MPAPLEDRFVGRRLRDLDATDRAVTWYVRASNASALPADSHALFGGATFMIQGLDYHYNSFVQNHGKLLPYRTHRREEFAKNRVNCSGFASLRQMTVEEDRSAQACAHDAIAYLSRLGQFYYFAKSARIDRAHLLKRVIELMPIRMKFAAHRSIDVPHGETQAVVNQQGISFAYRLFINDELEFQFRTDEGIIRFRLQDDHQVVLAECFAVLESFFRDEELGGPVTPADLREPRPRFLWNAGMAAPAGSPVLALGD